MPFCSNPFQGPPRLLLCGLALGALPPAEADEEIYELPALAVYSQQVANQTPVATFAMPVSGLRFEPRVDVQARNFAEAQADVTLRGGIFENTGFKLGAISTYDPQTGHYFAELPVAPAMLQSPRILTGADNATAGFNASVGTVAYGWRPIETRGEIAAAVGEFDANRESLYQGYASAGAGGRLTIAADAELARSESDGAVPYGDHDFWRAAGRVQLRGAGSQTDFFAGVQHKFFGWPNLYTPFGFNETEDLRTELFVCNHRAWSSPDSFWEVGAYYRRNEDDYEFDRAMPGASNPFEHTTRVRGLAVNGRQAVGGVTLDFTAQAMGDELESTSLTFGRYMSRDYLKLALVPGFDLATAAGGLRLRAGATYDDTNRDSSAVSPVAEAILTRPDGLELFAQYAESTQVPTYTALNSAAASGLFRGNPDLGRATSRNLEAGGRFKAAGWSVEPAVFYRWDDDLTDWTFARGVTARTANPVDIGTVGVEIVATRRTARSDLVLGYTFLAKDADYGSATVDASFYALNFARHRLTAAVTLRLGAGFELRMDNEFRVQEKNLLRVTGGDDAVLSSLGLYYLPPRVRGLEISALVENLWDSDFQEVPAVPAAPLQFSLGAAWRW